MRNLIKTVGILSLCIIFLSACGNGNGKTQVSKQTQSSSLSQTKKKKSNNSKETVTKQSNNKQSTNSKNPGNQLHLKLGDTANIKTNISHFLLTVSSIKLTNKKIHGYASQLDSYLIANISIKNIGENTINTSDTMTTFGVTDDLKGGGDPDEANQLGLKNAIKGKLKPGETKTGEAVYEVYNAKKYYLVSDDGLVAAELINKIKFTFKASEAQ